MNVVVRVLIMLFVGLHSADLARSSILVKRCTGSMVVWVPASLLRMAAVQSWEAARCLGNATMPKHVMYVPLD
jgi:hypothetical protein